MTNPPTDQALALVVSSLEEAWRDGYDDAHCDAMGRQQFDSTYSTTDAAHALLAKLAALPSPVASAAHTMTCVCETDEDGRITEPCKRHGDWARRLSVGTDANVVAAQIRAALFLSEPAALPSDKGEADGWKIEVARGKTVAVLYGAPEPEGTYSEDDPRSHNCDAMGCGSCGPHVLQIVNLHPARPDSGAHACPWHYSSSDACYRVRCQLSKTCIELATGPQPNAEGVAR